MKIIINTILLLTIPSSVQSARFGLLRITESNAGIDNNNAPVADFRSLFEEDANFNVRGLFGVSLSLSLSMSVPTLRDTTTPISTVQTSPPDSIVPTTTTAPVSSPISKVTNNATDIRTSESENDSGTQGNATTPTTVKSSSRNVAMIVVGSCALLALIAVGAKKLSSNSSSSLSKGAFKSSNESTGSSHEVSSVGSASDLDNNLMGNTNNMQNIQL